MSNLDGKTSDRITNEALSAEVARLNAIIQKFELEKEKEKNDAVLKALEAQEQSELDKAVAAEAESRKLAQVGVIRPDSMKSYSNLPIKLKLKLIESYGPDVVLQIAAKEKTGMSWSDWDSLNNSANKK